MEVVSATITDPAALLPGDVGIDLSIFERANELLNRPLSPTVAERELAEKQLSQSTAQAASSSGPSLSPSKTKTTSVNPSSKPTALPRSNSSKQASKQAVAAPPAPNQGLQLDDDLQPIDGGIWDLTLPQFDAAEHEHSSIRDVASQLDAFTHELKQKKRQNGRPLLDQAIAGGCAGAAGRGGNKSSGEPYSEEAVRRKMDRIQELEAELERKKRNKPGPGGKNIGARVLAPANAASPVRSRKGSSNSIGSNDAAPPGRSFEMMDNMDIRRNDDSTNDEDFSHGADEDPGVWQPEGQHNSSSNYGPGGADSANNRIAAMQLKRAADGAKARKEAEARRKREQEENEAKVLRLQEATKQRVKELQQKQRLQKKMKEEEDLLQKEKLHQVLRGEDPAESIQMSQQESQQRVAERKKAQEKEERERRDKEAAEEERSRAVLREKASELQRKTEERIRLRQEAENRKKSQQEAAEMHRAEQEEAVRVLKEQLLQEAQRLARERTRDILAERREKEDKEREERELDEAARRERLKKAREEYSFLTLGGGGGGGAVAPSTGGVAVGGRSRLNSPSRKRPTRTQRPQEQRVEKRILGAENDNYGLNLDSIDVATQMKVAIKNDAEDHGLSKRPAPVSGDEERASTSRPRPQHDRGGNTLPTTPAARQRSESGQQNQNKNKRGSSRTSTLPMPPAQRRHNSARGDKPGSNEATAPPTASNHVKDADAPISLIEQNENFEIVGGMNPFLDLDEDLFDFQRPTATMPTPGDHSSSNAKSTSNKTEGRTNQHHRGSFQAKPSPGAAAAHQERGAAAVAAGTSASSSYSHSNHAHSRGQSVVNSVAGTPRAGRAGGTYSRPTPAAPIPTGSGRPGSSRMISAGQDVVMRPHQPHGARASAGGAGLVPASAAGAPASTNTSTLSVPHSARSNISNKSRTSAMGGNKRPLPPLPCEVATATGGREYRSGHEHPKNIKPHSGVVRHAKGAEEESPPKLSEVRNAKLSQLEAFDRLMAEKEQQDRRQRIAADEADVSDEEEQDSTRSFPNYQEPEPITEEKDETVPFPKSLAAFQERQRIAATRQKGSRHAEAEAGAFVAAQLLKKKTNAGTAVAAPHRINYVGTIRGSGGDTSADIQVETHVGSGTGAGAPGQKKKEAWRRQKPIEMPSADEILKNMKKARAATRNV